MNQNSIQDSALYRFRYGISCLLIIILLVGFSLWKLGDIPSGYSAQDISSITSSATLQLSSTIELANLPFHILQKISLHFFGITTLGAYAPSIIIGIITGVCLLALLTRLFKANVAIITTLLAITASQFLLATRSAAPDIMMLFWPVVIILLAILVSQQAKYSGLWRFLLFVCIAGSLYTPKMIYLVVAALLAAIFHPHLRFIIRYSTTPIGYTILGLIICSLLIPMGWVIYHTPWQGLSLLGLPENFPSLSTYADNLKLAILQWANVFYPAITTTITPAFNVVTIVLAIIGFLQVLRDHHSSRSYVILIWIACLTPLAGFHPEQIIVLFVPFIILVGIGIQRIIHEWYRLFPRNPYARVSGLVPIGVLISGMLMFNLTSYFYGMAYSPTVSQYFSNDIQLLRQRLGELPAGTQIGVVVPTHSIATYDLLRRDFPNIKVGDELPGTPITIVASASSIRPTEPPKRLIVNTAYNQSLRFYIYQ